VQNFLAVPATNHFRHLPLHVQVATICCHSYLYNMAFSSCSVILKKYDSRRCPVYISLMTV
jgi:hypothetical protein